MLNIDLEILYGRRGSLRFSLAAPVALAVIALLAAPTAPAHAEGQGAPRSVPGRLDGDGSRRDQAAAAADASLRRPQLEAWEDLQVAAALPPARTSEPERLQAMADWNHARRVPLQVGFARHIERSLEVVLDETSPDLAKGHPALAGGRLTPERTVTDRVVWTGRFRVEEARDVRLHLTRATLPPGAEIRVYGRDGALLGPVGPEIVADGGLWTPTIEGPEVWLEVSVASSALREAKPCRFTVEEVLETFELDAQGRPLLTPHSGFGGARPSGTASAVPFGTAGAPPQAAAVSSDACLSDISCSDQSTDIVNASHGIGRMIFISGGGAFACTGGLLNDASSSGTPYFLTAKHCISLQVEASSLEVTWDYRTSTCGGTPPSTSALPKSFGGTLLTTNKTSDSTLIRLTSVPGGRFFFGWTTDPPTTATLLRRVSHPNGGPQVYSETQSNEGRMGTCTALPLTGFIYENMTFAGIDHGSSGAPVWTGAGTVVGELFGICGPNPNDNCLTSNSIVDGRFSVSYPLDKPYIDVPIPEAPQDFQPLLLKPKRVVLTWTDAATDHNKFQILQLLDSGWQVIKQRGRAATRVGVGRLTPSTTYQFGLRACKGLICSDMVTTSATTTTPY